jgi:hypothetical protein
MLLLHTMRDPRTSIEERASELIHFSNSENGLAALRLIYIRCEEGSRERNLQDLLGSSVTHMIDAILNREFPRAGKT